MSVTFVEERDTVQKTEYKVNNKRGYLIVKRVFDIVASFLALVVLFVPMAIVGLLVWVESPGPVIYKQERLGKDGEIFIMYKFRSMYINSEKNGPQWASKNDSRCTRIGKFIRIFHIDELPQLVNVLKGEMSIVGPRPEREYFYEAFEKIVPDFRVRLKVKPGLTGYSQTNGCYDLTPEERFSYDTAYMAERSLWVDFVCIMKTFVVIVNRKGAR